MPQIIDPINPWTKIVIDGEAVDELGDPLEDEADTPFFGNPNGIGMAGRTDNVLAIDWTTDVTGGVLTLEFFNGAKNGWIVTTTTISLTAPSGSWKIDTQGRVVRLTLSGSPDAGLQVWAALIPGNQFAGGN